MRGFQSAMSEYDFGVDFNFLVRCLAGVATGSIMLEGSFLKTPAPKLQAAWEEMKAAFEHLVNVLRHDAFIDDLKDLPTNYVLVPVTIYLARQGGSFPSDAVKKRFIRWLYLAGLWARYSGAAETKLQLGQLIARDLGASVSSFLTVTFHAIDGEDVCQITVEASDHPVYAKEGQEAVFYLRAGNATRALPVNEVVKYVQHRWGKTS